MTQIATVKSTPKGGVVLVSVARETACGHDCEKCAGCGAQAGSLTVQARCSFPVSVGEKVEIYSGQKVLAFAALVYLVPVVLFLLGYFLSVGLPVWGRYLCAGAGFALGLCAAVVCDRNERKKKAITYEIVRKI